MMDVQCRIDRAGQELRATEVDPDHAAGRHDRPPYRAACRHPQSPTASRSTASTARARPGCARPGARDGDELQRLRGDARPGRASTARARASRAGASFAGCSPRSPPGSRVSSVVFLFSAQIQQGKIGDDANALLGGAGYPLWSPNNVLVLGSDQRTAGHARARRADERRPRGLDHAHARRRRREQPAVDRARHGRRHPRPRPQQDQRRVRLRRHRARDPDGRGSTRASTSTTSSS